MEKKSWLILFIILALMALVFIFWGEFIIKNEEIIAIDYCKVNDDCVLAVNTNSCCIQPVAMNKDVVNIDEDYVVYDESFNSDDYVKKNDCSAVRCAAPPRIGDFLISCLNNKCSITIPI